MTKPLSSRRALAAAAVLAAATLTCPTSHAGSITHGVYSTWFPFVYDVKTSKYITNLFQPTNVQSAAHYLAQNTGVVGLVVDVPWDALQLSKPTLHQAFDPTALQTLERVIAAAQSAHFAVTLSIRAAEETTPAWVTQEVLQNNPEDLVDTYDLNGSTSRLCRHVIGAVPWDSTFRAERENFISALGAQFNPFSSIDAITIAFANWFSTDMFMPVASARDEQQCTGGNFNYQTEWMAVFGIADPEGTQLQQMQAVQSRLNSEGQSLLKVATQAFPQKVVKLAIHEMSNYDFDESGQNPTQDGVLLSEIVPYANSLGIYLQQDSLSADSLSASAAQMMNSGTDGEGYASYLLNQRCPQCGLQEGSPYDPESEDQTAPCTLNQPDLGTDISNAVKVGLTYNPQFMEFFQADACNVNYNSIFLFATSQMGGAARVYPKHRR